MMTIKDILSVAEKNATVELWDATGDTVLKLAGFKARQYEEFPYLLDYNVLRVYPSISGCKMKLVIWFIR